MASVANDIVPHPVAGGRRALVVVRVVLLNDDVIAQAIRVGVVTRVIARAVANEVRSDLVASLAGDGDGGSGEQSSGGEHGGEF